MKVAIKNDIETLATEELTPRQFKSGSRGYFGSFKATVDGKKYQIGINAVEIGSKPGSNGKKAK